MRIRSVGIVGEGYVIPSSFISTLRRRGVHVYVYPDATLESDTGECSRAIPMTVLGCDAVVKIDTPDEKFLESFFSNPRPRQLWTMAHVEILDLLPQTFAKHHKFTLVQIDKFVKDGKRCIECFRLSGACGAGYGLQLFKHHHFPSIVPTVVVLGNGECAAGARDFFFYESIPVIQLPRNAKNHLIRLLRDADIIINGVNWPQDYRGRVQWLSDEHLSTLKRNSVIIDLDVDYENMGPISGCRPTYPAAPNFTRVIRDVPIHYACVWGWPIFEPQTAGYRYYSQLLPFLLRASDEPFSTSMYRDN